jgi:uncharacterized protein YjiS (DUF1127 family)
MTAYVPQHLAAATLFRIGSLLHAGARVLRKAAESLDRFIAARRKSIEDRRALVEMSARELRDIGVCDAQLYSRGNVDARPAYERGEWRGVI